MPPLQGMESFAMEESPLEYPREMVDFSQMALPLMFDTQPQAAGTEENQVENTTEDPLEEDDHNDVALVAAIDSAHVVAAVTSKRKRERFSYSLKHLKATYELYLNPDKISDFKNTYPDTYEVIEIEGQVKECPRKERNFYRIQWNVDTQGVDPQWLRTNLDNTPGNKVLLKEGIACMQGLATTKTKKRQIRNNHRTTTATTATTTVARGRQVPTVTAGTATQAHNDTPVGSTPPRHIRAQAVANIRTSASISSLGSRSQSTISTLSGTQRVRLVTRGQKEASDDALESESENEDEAELDEEPDYIVTGDRPNSPTWEDVSDMTGAQEVGEDEDQATNEGDGIHALIRQLKWKFVCIDKNAPPAVLDKHMRKFYDGPEGLRHGVAHSFQDPFGCFENCGGLDYGLVARLAAGSNDYFHRFKRPCLDRNAIWHGVKWTDITVEEMYRFLGILLRISMEPVDGGGYNAYFSKENKIVNPGGRNGKPKEIQGTAGWAHHYMTLIRFKQIRGAFHPEEKCAGDGGDKCYMLRHLINTCNSVSKFTFWTPKDLSFDEGGVGCRSRYCPVRQYNQSKPQKFRVDFFVLSCARKYQILHIDVYQGKNGNNVGINRNLTDMPTTQKAVANAAYALGLDKKADGARHIAMDNRYQCPELAVFLRERCNVYSSGTCRNNRRGWKEGGLDLKKSLPRGTYQQAYDDQNRVLLTQWVDSRVVNVVSTLNDTTIQTCQRQIGSHKQTFPCPAVVRKYQQDMGSIDRNDQMRMHGGGFSNKAHFKKWYKKVYLAILDCMLLNSWIAWNMSVDESPRTGRRKLKRHEFFQYVSQSLLDYREPTLAYGNLSPEQVRQYQAYQYIGDEVHIPRVADKGSRCIVCRLELRWKKELGQKQMASGVGTCICCNIDAHASLLPSSNRMIHTLPQFKGLTCFQIAHSPEGMDLWRRGQSLKGSYKLDKKHAMYIELRQKHGLPIAGRRKKDQGPSSTTEAAVDSDETDTIQNSSATTTLRRSTDTQSNADEVNSDDETSDT